MKTPAPTHAANRPDYTDASTLADRLMQTAEELAGMTEGVAKARVVREFHGERVKRALATQVREFLASKDSATAAETKGRASVGYGEALMALETDLLQAEQVIAAHEAKRVLWESLRSNTALARSIVSNV